MYTHEAISRQSERKSCLACVYRVMDARGKFGEPEICVRVAQGAAESNSSFLSALQTSQVHLWLDIRTAKGMSKFFYNKADKNACFLINCKILVARDAITNASIGWLQTRHNRVRHKCDVTKMKFLKLWDLSGSTERTMSKRPTCQKWAFRGKLSLRS